jgi:hypothetical protein
VIGVGPRYPGHGDQQDAATREALPRVLQRPVEVRDQLQGLDQDEAVEPTGGKGIQLREIGDDCGVGVRGVDVDDLDPGWSRVAKGLRISGVTHFEHVASNIPSTLGEEALDVKTIDGGPPVEAVVGAEGLAPAKIAPVRLVEACKPTSQGSLRPQRHA